MNLGAAEPASLRVIVDGANVHYEMRPEIFFFLPINLSLDVVCACRGSSAHSAPLVAVVARARDALARFLVDLSTHIFHFYGCDVCSYDEKRRRAVHVVWSHDE